MTGGRQFEPSNTGMPATAFSVSSSVAPAFSRD
jgi:hypothetical protein